MSKLDPMGKKKLRAAHKDALVKNYSKMDVATMRAALTALRPIAPMEVAFKEVKRSKPKNATPLVKAEREVRNGVKRPLDPNGKCGQA